MGRSLPLALGLRVGFSLALGVRVLLALVFWGLWGWWSGFVSGCQVSGLAVGVGAGVPGSCVSGRSQCRGFQP